CVMVRTDASPELQIAADFRFDVFDRDEVEIDVKMCLKDLGCGIFAGSFYRLGPRRACGLCFILLYAFGGNAALGPDLAERIDDLARILRHRTVYQIAGLLPLACDPPELLKP